MREDPAELVVRDLSDEGDVEPQRSGARHAVGGRSAADFARRAHRLVKLVGLLRRQQLHAALRQSMLLDERVVGGGDDVDEGVADRHDVEAGGGHGAARYPRE